MITYCFQKGPWTINHPHQHNPQLLGVSRWNNISLRGRHSCSLYFCQLVQPEDSSDESSVWQMQASTTLFLWLTAWYFRQINLSKIILYYCIQAQMEIRTWQFWGLALQLTVTFPQTNELSFAACSLSAEEMECCLRKSQGRQTHPAAAFCAEGQQAAPGSQRPSLGLWSVRRLFSYI